MLRRRFLLFLYLILIALCNVSLAQEVNCQKNIRGNSKLLILVEGTSTYKKQILQYYKRAQENNVLKAFSLQAYPSEELSSSELILRKKVLSEYNYPKRMSLMMDFLFRYPLEIAEHDLIYVPQRRYKKSLKCFRKDLKNNNYQEIKFMGMSWGAISAMKMINQLSKEGIQVNSLLTFDPVSKWFRSLKNLLSNKSNHSHFFDNTHLDYWGNFYQKSDKTSVIVGVKGNSYPRANTNIEVKTDKKGHLTILKEIDNQRQLKQIIQDFLN